MKITYQGMRATRKHLVVSAVMEVGQSIRFVDVRIPIAEIDLDAVGGAVDAKVRNDLVSIWAAERGDALPGL